MNITDLLTITSIDLDAKVSSKEEAIDHLVDLMMTTGKINNRELYRKDIFSRESQGSTGVGEGIAIPHAQSEAVDDFALAAMVVKDGVDFDALDNQKAKLFFMIAASNDGGNDHLKALARLSKMLMDQDFKESLIMASDTAVFLDLIAKKEKTLDKPDLENNGTYDVLAVTACPTGIAHTYMAAKSLEEKAQELGIKIKVETNGASGIDNPLTHQEIAVAKCIIVAVDKQIEMSRFDGKPVIITRVADGINKPEELLLKATNENVEIYHDGDDSKRFKQSRLRILYMQLCEALNRILPIFIGAGALLSIPIFIQEYNLFNINTIYDNLLLTNSYLAGHLIQTIVPIIFAGYIGQAVAKQPGFAVSLAGGIGMMITGLYYDDANGAGLLGGIIAGFLGGYIVLGLQKLWQKLPESYQGLSTTVIYPIFGVIIAFIISLVISPYIGALNQIIAVSLDSMNLVGKLIAGIILGAMMAVDMGGPINKIAYIFAISQILEGNYSLMAAVMAAGMVPPLVIALATTFFKNKFTENQHKLGRSNYLKGLMFISEGTLPFVKEDRRLVTAVCMIASALTGAFSMVYNCGISLPHGGIFVLPLVIHPLRYVVAILIGSLCGAMIYGIFKEKDDM
ncbi:fructose-specific PTS transporter subunit EIIC [uncultured Thomasclavelia sp.]|uniref:PTS fructose transporter subunit IIABC n=1 Tax=uncultured Thomasclavelia sp. TaxID=3025759 RepID=UPI00280AFC91|nr:fructose-specific PTS transporter subunit EIIC [uncultured Thomasclavelia sp.]